MKAQNKRPFYINFIISSCAAASATIFTNPLEVAKTRIQLQGELQAKVYTNPIQALFKICREEGISAIQKGLLPQIIYTVCTNGVRLSMYPKIQMLLNKTNKGEYILLKNCLSGIFSGIISTFTGSPFFLINVRLKAQSKAKFSMSQQRKIHGVCDGLKQAIQEGGIRKLSLIIKQLNRGLYRGCYAQMLRLATSSAFQLPTFEFAAYHLKKTQIPKTAQIFLSTAISGLMTAIAMNPADIITSRLSNQPINPETKQGMLYSGIFNCFIKIVKKEGSMGLFKGLSAQCFRIVPQTMLTLLFREQYQKVADKMCY